MRRTQTIEKLLTQEVTSTDFDYTVTYHGIDITPVSSAVVRRLLKLNYLEWSHFTIKGTLLQQYENLVSDYKFFHDETAYNFSKIYAAMREEYSPVSDYSRKETTAYKLTHETEYGKEVTNEADNYESKTDYNSSITDGTTTYNDTSLRNATKSQKDGYDTVTLNGTMTTTLSGTDTVTDTRDAADNIKEITGFNTSPQKAIENEIAFRLADDFADLVVKEFARRYLFLKVGD